MAENYKHLYEQMKKIVACYQDEVVPALREIIEEKENQREKAAVCKWCMSVSYTEKPFKVITQKGREVELCFDFCPSCGRKLNGST